MGKPIIAGIEPLLNKYFFIVILLVSVVLPFVGYEYSLLLCMFIILCCLLYLYLRHKTDDSDETSFLTKVCLVGFLIRFMLAIIFSAKNMSFPDSYAYESYGLSISQEWKMGNFNNNYPATHFLYYAYNALFYYLFGFFPSIVRLFNAFLGILAGINVYTIAKQISGKATARLTVVLTIFFPSIIMWQVFNLKESLVVFLLTLIIKQLILYRENFNIGMLILTLFYSLLLTLTRVYSGVFMSIVIIIFFLAFGNLSKTKRYAIILVSLVLIGVLTYKSGVGLFGYKYAQGYDISYINNSRIVEYRGGSEVLMDEDTSTLGSLIKFTPLGYLYFLFSPFPWQVDGSMLQFASLLENILWYVLFLAFPFGVYAAYKKQKVACFLLLIILFAFTGFYSIQMGNMGLAYRMRGQLLPIFFIFISIGIGELNRRWMQKYSENSSMNLQKGNNL